MSEQGPTVTIYLNRRSGEFYVQPYARQFGVPQPFGIQAVLPHDVGDEKLLEFILENLAKTDRQEYDLSQAPRPSSEERRRRLKEDRPIRVCRTRNGFELAPLRRMQDKPGINRGQTGRFLLKPGETRGKPGDRRDVFYARGLLAVDDQDVVPDSVRLMGGL
jgi:hypothetical protein